MIEDQRFTLNLGGCTITLDGLDEEGYTWISAKCSGQGSYVAIKGFAETDDIVGWKNCLSQMYEALQGNCGFSAAEPEFSIKLECENLGQLKVAVNISNNTLAECHLFNYEIDQSYLPAIIQTIQAYLQSLASEAIS